MLMLEDFPRLILPVVFQQASTTRATFRFHLIPFITIAASYLHLLFPPMILRQQQLAVRDGEMEVCPLCIQVFAITLHSIL
jgi:hypothetical protein